MKKQSTWLKQNQRKLVAFMAAFFIGAAVLPAEASVSFADRMPENVKAASYSFSKIRVSWDPVEDADGYTVYRAMAPEGPFQKCYETDNPKKLWYINTGRTAGKEYWYKVRGWKYAAAGDTDSPAASIGKKIRSRYSASDSAFSRPGRAEITGLTSEGWIYRAFRLTWNPVSGASGYQISMKEKDAEDFTFCGNFRGTEGSVEIPDKTKEYILRVRAYRTVSGKKVYGLFSKETAYRFSWDEEALKDAGYVWLQERWPQMEIREKYTDGTLRTPYNSSWSAAWPLRFSRYEPWEDVEAELKEALEEDLQQYGSLPDSVCLYAGAEAESNYVHLYLLH